MPFDLEQFISDCRSAVKQDRAQEIVRDIAARAVSDSAAVLKRLGEPTRAGMERLYHAADLTIVNVIWAPYMTLLPHNHRMWAVIAMYTGREDNIFWRRVPGALERQLEAAGARALCERYALPMGQDIVHSVTNPIPRFTGALHIYGGDFFNVTRSEWDPETLHEQPSDGEKMARRFEEANALMLKRLA